MGLAVTGRRLTNETQLVIVNKEPAVLPFKSDYPKKDGIFATLLAAEAVAAGDTSLNVTGSSR